MLLLPHLLLAIAWIAFCLLHSLLATNRLKQKIIPRFRKGGVYYRMLYTVFALASFAAVVLYQFSITSIFLFHSLALLRIAGMAGAAAGLIIMGICIRRYFFHLSGLRGLVNNDPDRKLLLDGIHRHVRHPLYTGTFIFIWSLMLIYPSLSLLISNMIITFYTVAGANLEEKKLVLEFGRTYIAYLEKTPMFIPRPGKARLTTD